MYTSGRWQAASVMPCRQIWVLSNLHPPVAEPALCQYWASGPLWSVSQGEAPWQVTNMCKINFKLCTPFSFWAFQRGTALVPYSAEMDSSQVLCCASNIYLPNWVRHFQRICMARVFYRHHECCTDPASVWCAHFNALWRTAFLAQYQQAANTFSHVSALDVLEHASHTVQGVFELYDPEKYFSLAEWIVVAGAIIGLFAVSVPNLHLLRVWSSLSCLLVLIFSIITIAISCHDGALLFWPPQFHHSSVALCLLQAVAYHGMPLEGCIPL